MRITVQPASLIAEQQGARIRLDPAIGLDLAASPENDLLAG